MIHISYLIKKSQDHICRKRDYKGTWQNNTLFDTSKAEWTPMYGLYPMLKEEQAKELLVRLYHRFAVSKLSINNENKQWV